MNQFQYIQKLFKDSIRENAFSTGTEQRKMIMLDKITNFFLNKEVVFKTLDAPAELKYDSSEYSWTIKLSSYEYNGNLMSSLIEAIKKDLGWETFILVHRYLYDAPAISGWTVFLYMAQNNRFTLDKQTFEDAFNQAKPSYTLNYRVVTAS